MSDPTRFSFRINGISARFDVVEFSATEYISSPFELSLMLTSKDEISFEDAVNQSAVLTILKSEANRYIHGIIDQLVYTEQYADVFIYQARVVPSLWLLYLKHDCRVFQDKSVPDIIQSVLDEHSLNHKLDFRLKRNYPILEFCAQYQESDFDFISRLMEQEGIFYFFEHNRSRSSLVVADSPTGHRPFQEKSSVRYAPEAEENIAADGIFEFQFTRNMHPGKVTLSDYDFKSPNKNLTYQAQADEYQDYEIYLYPGRYKDQRGRTLAGIRLKEEMTFREMAVGNSAFHLFTPGSLFRLTQHEQPKFNRQYLMTAVTHSGHQPSTYPSVGDDLRQPGYFNDFVAIPFSVPFVPARKTPRPRISGPQTAVVTGPAGEEIYTDEYGRVKVQFHWDRIGSNDDKSSAWVRVGQISAGGGFGAMFLPRVGQEVIVDFLEGNPDDPLIIGRVYNGANTPPYSLPDRKTVSTITTSSSKGGGGQNELRFEDKKGSEEIYLHGQRNLTVVVENEKDETIQANDSKSVGNNQSIIIGRNLNETVEGRHLVTVGGSQSETIGTAKQVTIGTALTESIGGKKQVTVGGNKSESVGSRSNISVGSDLAQDIGSNLKINVGRNLSENVGKTRTLAAEKIAVTAKDEIRLKSGKASFVLKKNGDIVISGKNITVKGSGNVVLKGKKLSIN